MRETIERRTCDQCGAVAEHDPHTFGGMPFREWQSIGIPESPFSSSYYDACSSACAIEILTNGPKPRINIDQPKEPTP